MPLSVTLALKQWPLEQKQSKHQILTLLNNKKKADIKFHSPFFVYLYCTSRNTNLDRKGTSNYNSSNTGQNLDKQKMELLFIKDFGHLQIYSYSFYTYLNRH